MMTVCQDSKCEVGGDNKCCHECAEFATCRDAWKCDDVGFYADCKECGGVSVSVDVPASAKTAPS